MISSTPNPEQAPLFHAVGCACLYQESVLLVQRQSDKSYPLCWGVPTGKVEATETPPQTVIREVFEETGIILSAANINYVGDYYITNDDFTFRYTLYMATFVNPPKVRINSAEHLAYRWVDLNETDGLTLVPDLDTCLAAVRAIAFPLQQLDLFPGMVDHSPYIPLAASQQVVQIEMQRRGRQLTPSGQIGAVVVIGPPGAGKSTVISEVIEHHPELSRIWDDSMLNPSSRQHHYLRRFLQGDNSCAFPCQIEALVNRYWETVDAPANSVIDETIYSTLAYSKALRYQGRLTDYEFQTFYATYLSYCRWLPRPSCLIHLTASVDVLYQRIKSRGRTIERKSHNLDYLTVLHRAFAEVAGEVALTMPVHNIDSSKMTVDDVVSSILSLRDAL